MNEDAPPASPPSRGFLATLAGLYFEPEKSFAAALRSPRFWTPLAVLTALNLAFTAVWLRKVDAEAFFRAEMEYSGAIDNIRPEQLGPILEAQARALPIFGWMGGLFGAALLVLVTGAIYTFVLRFFLASEIDFARVLAVVAWSFLAVAAVTQPLTLGVLALKADWSINPARALQANLAAALDPDSVPRALFAMADSFDLFSFAVLFLLHVGFRVGTGLGARPVAAGVLVPWALYVLGKAGFIALAS